jgi:hypothetical protein
VPSSTRTNNSGLALISVRPTSGAIDMYGDGLRSRSRR